MKTISIEQAHEAVIESFATVAPDIRDELGTVDQHTDVFEELELDSMDHVNVMTQVFERTGVEVPERQYGQLRTLSEITDYVWSATGGKLMDL